VELGRFGFAAAVGFAAGATGGGDAAWEQGEGEAEGDGFWGGAGCFLLTLVLMYIYIRTNESIFSLTRLKKATGPLLALGCWSQGRSPLWAGLTSGHCCLGRPGEGPKTSHR
jgi:hypothetical protein